MKIVSLVDDYGDFMQVTVLSRALRQRNNETVVYAGPHAELFQARAYFEHLEPVQPEVQLEVGTHSPGAALGELLIRLDRVLLDLRPDLVTIRGDSPAALAGALAASRQQIPTARLEAGGRAYSKRHPREMTRVLADRLADALFCSTHDAAQRLADESIVGGVHVSGDLALDVIRRHLATVQQRSTILQRVGLYPGYYLLVVLGTGDFALDARSLPDLVRALNTIREPIIFPVAKQIRAAFDRSNLTLAPHVLAIDPLGFVDMLSLEAHARAILTDVSGAQRNAYHLSVPCITLRDDTEAGETVQAGWNRLVGSDVDRIVDAVRNFLPPTTHPPLYGDGRAADYIATTLDEAPIYFGQNYDRLTLPLVAEVPLT